ncbi:lytic murein transglycosylase [Nocardioides mangrovicus]|uniref:Lytic murein transglycosylase n=1 Tax=Nocardioides mangrovicus TaxID=2478913 RepID=A0A3L8P0K0_9ACTN|nr:lytic murein transglycosylase [Nocardioides mangrovicus]
MRAVGVVAALLGSLVLVSLVARGGTSPELADLTAGRLPTAAPAVVDLVPAASTGAVVPAPAPAWVRRTSAATGIPRPALRAYGRAEISLARELPSCHLGWTTLAGIGWVESQQGTVGGRALGADAVPSAPVTGPVLPDGSHAEGPMQFLASTWDRWAADGDGDGRADVDDLDDAALAAGRYLCADGHDLATGAGWGTAVFAYNHSWDYVQAVFSAAQAYDGRVRR